MGPAGPAWSRMQGLGEVAVPWASAVEKRVLQSISGLVMYVRCSLSNRWSLRRRRKQI